MTVTTEAFLHKMQTRWESFGNAPSESLLKVWEQQCNTFNKVISEHGEAVSRWYALRPETGTGKTQGLCVYASMLHLENHPGLLIVVRLIEQANELASTINQLAGSSIAASHHSKNRLDVATAKATPVLVITHEAFRRGLISVSGGEDTWNWDLYSAWRGGRRKLTVIDEELDLLQEASLTLADVLKAKVAVHSLIPHHFPEQYAILDLLEAELRRIDPASHEGLSERLLWETWSNARPVDMQPVCNALMSEAASILGASELHSVCATLMDAEHQVRSWCWMSRQAAGKGQTAVKFNGGKLIAANVTTGVVVLDATADLDVTYQLFEDKVRVLPRPANARRYGNVTLYQSWGNRTGKHSRTKTKEEDVAAVIGDLNQRLSSDSKVLVVTHKDIEPAFAAHETSFKLSVAHWGALDGRNDWSDHDVIVLFTLPHRPPEWSVNLFFSAKGPKPTEWLRDKTYRGYRNHEDIRKSLEMGKVATEVVQAINRVRCRRVINSDGDCAPTKVFLYMPAIGAKHLQDKILSSMPGVQLENWRVGAKAEKSTPSKWAEWLLQTCRDMKPGTQLRRADIREQAGSISENALDRLIKKLHDPGSELRQQLDRLGVTYACKVLGGKRVNVLVKV